MTLDDPCPMTGERHLWGEWERVVSWERDVMDHMGCFGPPTGDRVRECRTCGRWEADWADAQSQREETL